MTTMHVLYRWVKRLILYQWDTFLYDIKCGLENHHVP